LPKSSLKKVIASIMQSEELQSETRAFLERFIADPRSNDIGSKIEAAMDKKHGELAKGLARPLIYEVLAVLAGYATDSTAFLKQAEKAESLAKFLRGPDPRRCPPLLPKSEVLISSLKEAARALRQLAKNQVNAGLRQASRTDRNGSRARVNFSRSVSELLLAFCGQFIDEAALFLTDIAFPKHETTIDQILSARRPTTRAKRRKSAE
jgi:hypothetical protein